MTQSIETALARIVDEGYLAEGMIVDGNHVDMKYVDSGRIENKIIAELEDTGMGRDEIREVWDLESKELKLPSAINLNKIETKMRDGSELQEGDAVVLISEDKIVKVEESSRYGIRLRDRKEIEEDEEYKVVV